MPDEHEGYEHNLAGIQESLEVLEAKADSLAESLDKIDTTLAAGLSRIADAIDRVVTEMAND